MSLPERFELFRKTHGTQGVTLTSNGLSVARETCRLLGDGTKVLIGFDSQANEMIIVPTANDDPNGYVLNRSNNAITSSRLNRFWKTKNWRMGHYPATVDGQTLIVKLETAPTEMASV